MKYYDDIPKGDESLILKAQEKSSTILNEEEAIRFLSLTDFGSRFRKYLLKELHSKNLALTIKE